MSHPVRHNQILIPALAVFSAMLLTGFTSQFLIASTPAASFLIASMGASALLLFVIPSSPLSQPWSLFGGQMISAFTGISCALLINDIVIATAISVSLAIIAMMYLRCLHPPGGATALIPIMMVDEIEHIGYLFIFFPVALNTLILLLLSLFINRVILHRHYASHSVPEPPPIQEETEAIIQSSPFSAEDLNYAFEKMDTYIDVDEDDLFRIYALATAHAEERGRHVPCLRRNCERKITTKNHVRTDKN
ncbi:MAG: HPP family protein [Chromatiales bacterium]|nr:HPP family protein [Chromatiales bacterium]